MALIDNLIAYYALDEASGNALDSHSSHYDLTETSGTIDATTGKVSGARDFETADSEWFECNDNADLSVGDIDFTIAAWVKFETTGSASIVYKGGSNDLAYDLGCNANGGTFRLRISSAAGFANLTTRLSSTFGNVSLGTWYFVVAWHDSVANTINICVNDGAVDSTSYSAGSYDEAGKFFLGSNPFGEHFDGMLDEVGFWKRVLTAGEITSLYNAGAGLAYPFGGGGAVSSPVVIGAGVGSGACLIGA